MIRDKRLAQNDAQRLDTAVQRLKDLIENDGGLYRLCENALGEIPGDERFARDACGRRRVDDFQSLISAMNSAIQRAPPWNSGFEQNGIIGCPLNEVLIWLMNTQSGSIIFQRSDINKHLQSILRSWARYLDSPNSTHVLNPGPSGWLSQNALNHLTNNVSSAQGSSHVSHFQDAYDCDPSSPTLGFRSWNEFFTRRFRPHIRPVTSPHNPSIITNACESSPSCLVRDICPRSPFWLKGQPYSVLEMLDNDPLATPFIGGTCYQAFLSALSYHRWHSPVCGTILKIRHIPGSYFAANPHQGFSNLDRQGRPDPDRSAPDRSQRYLTSVATRTAIFIQSSNPQIGPVVFLAVGMAEISSCEATVVEGQYVEKGQELGSFHYGGSTHCLLFRRGLKLRFVAEPELGQNGLRGWEGKNLAVKAEIARIIAD